LILTTSSVLLPALLFLPAYAPVTWTGPNTGTNTSNLHYSTSVVQDQLGNVYIFWDQNPGIYYTVTTTGQLINPWPTPQQYTLNGNNYDLEPAPIVLKNGTLIMFFSSKRGNNYDIYYSRYNNGAWSPESRLTTSAASDQGPVAMQDRSGKIWLAWTRTETGDIKIKFVDANNNGAWDAADPTVNETLKGDSKITFVDSNNNNAWDAGEAVTYDANGDGKYTTGRYYNDTLISGILPANNTIVKSDSRIKYVDFYYNNLWGLRDPVAYDANNNGIYDPGEQVIVSSPEPILYDSNGNGVYDLGEPVIAGIQPTQDAPLTIDPRLGFMDSNGDNLWNSGEFVVYDPNANSAYDPKLMYVDSNTNNIWDIGESIIYKANSTFAGFTGNARCSGSLPPAADCVIIGSAPSQSTLLKTDTRLKFVDLNADSSWEPGETLTYDTNNNGLYDTGEQAIAPLTTDAKLKFIGTGTNWVQGNTVVYDVNGNNLYDSRIKFVDTNGNGVWDTGETVVYHTNLLNSIYDYSDTPIFETTPQGDVGHPLKNDPGLRFVDLCPVNALPPPCPNGTSSTNGSWDQGEPVVYDFTSSNPSYNLNGIYDGRIKFVDTNTNGQWDSGETVVYDTDASGPGAGIFNTGRYHNDTIIAGSTPANNTVLSQDSKLKFYDANGNTIWNIGEPVVYDTNNNNLYETTEPVVTGTTPNPMTGITTGLGETIVAYGSPATLTALRTDPHLKYFDTNGNSVWDPGEAVVYDTNNNNVYESNESLVAGPVPNLNADTKIKYVDSNSNGIWNTGETVIYDTNNDGKYTTGRYHNDTLIAGLAPANNTAISFDPRIKYVDANADGVWTTGETVVYDTNGNGLYDIGEPVISGTAPTLKTDSKIRYADSNGNSIWDSAEPVVYDANSDGLFQKAEFVIRGIIPQGKTSLTISLGEAWIAGTNTPIPGSTLKSDPKLKFLDLNGNASWNSGEPVEYDVNGNGIFDSGTDTIVAGNPVPAIGTNLKSDEATLAGTTAAPGTHTIVQDTKIKFVDANNNNAWDAGETVVYDTDLSGPGLGVYNFGRNHNDTIISGAAPANNTALRTDPKLKYFEQSTDTHWDTGEDVFYDTNNDGTYQAGEPLVATFQVPSASARLTTDSKIKYFDANANNVWDSGESIVYDTNNDGLYSSGEPVLAFSVPTLGAALKTDSKIKFADTTGNLIWDRGETVVYDFNGNSLYDATEPIIVGSNPTGGQPLRSVTHIFYEIYNGASWSAEQRLTIQPNSDRTPSIGQTEDGRIWIAWSGERPPGPNTILYRTSTDGAAWTTEVQVTSSPTNFGDNDPSIGQDRNGTIWIVFSRNVACGNCGKAAFQADLYTTSSNDNGATWNAATTLPGEPTTDDEIQPNLSQLSDNNLYIFFSKIVCGGSTCTVSILYYASSTPLLIHSARMNNFTSNSSATLANSTRAGQTVRLTANITNTGDYTGSFTFWAMANSTIIPSTTMSLVPGQTAVLTINWVTTGMKPGIYSLTANVTTTGESAPNFVDNMGVPHSIRIRPAGDVNGDCIVNIIDVTLVTIAFGRSIGSPGYNPKSDLNNDGTINIIDVTIVTTTFGKTC